MASFEIVMDRPNKRYYSAGDRLSGKVCFKSTQDTTIGSVSITFWGRSKTKITKTRSNGQGGSRRAVYRGRNNLVHMTTVLYRGHYKHSSPNYEWPFEFEIPSHAQTNLGGDRWDEGDARFLVSAEQSKIPLPSTLNALDQGWGSSAEGRIEYKLEASMMNPEKTFGDQQIEKAVFILQTMPSDDPRATAATQPSVQTQSFTVHSYKVDPQNQDRELSFREKARSVFSSSKLPAVQFMIHVTSPKFFAAGANSSVDVRMKYLPTPEGTNFTPPVFLKSYKVVICALTNVRSAREIIRMPDENFEDKYSIVATAQRHAQVSKDPFSKENDFTKIIPLDNLASLPDITPNFKTCNISREYRLRICLTFGCAEKEVSMERNSYIMVWPSVKPQNNLQILPIEDQIPVPMEPPAGSPVSSLNDSMLEVPDENLPAYADVSDEGEAGKTTASGKTAFINPSLR